MNKGYDDPFFAYYMAFLRRTVPVGCIPAGTIACYGDIYINSEEQENKMEVANTKIFEYCIVNFNEDGSPYISVGPCVMVTLGEENPRDIALLKIGQKHAPTILCDSEVQIRPFC